MEPVRIDKKIISFRLLESTGKANESQAINTTPNKETPIIRGSVVKGYTLKLKYADVSYYITLNFNENSELVEVFINSSSTSPQTNVLVQTLARMISNQLKYRVPIDKIVKHLDGMDSGEVFLVKFPGKEKGKFIKSLPDLLAKVLYYYSNEKELKKIVKEESKEENVLQDQEQKQSNIQSTVNVELKYKTLQCPECGDENVKYEEGCFTCLSCGYSKCA